MNVQAYLKNVTTLQYDPDKCIGCGRCTEVCPHGVFEMNDKKAGIRDRDACMECGACARNCQPQAIQVRAGVGCAYAIVVGMLRGTKPTCGCSDIENACC